MKEFKLRLRKDGSITIPKYVRTRYGFNHRDNFTVRLSSDGLTLHVESEKYKCNCCDAQVSQCDFILGLPVCLTCSESITQMIRRKQFTLKDSVNICVLNSESGEQLSFDVK